jgi:hypothetical protein
MDGQGAFAMNGTVRRTCKDSGIGNEEMRDSISGVCRDCALASAASCADCTARNVSVWRPERPEHNHAFAGLRRSPKLSHGSFR